LVISEVFRLLLGSKVQNAGVPISRDFDGQVKVEKNKGSI